MVKLLYNLPEIQARLIRKLLVGISLIFLVSLSLISCSKGEVKKKVVLYSSVDATYTREIVSRFEELYDIKVNLISDTEAAKSTGLVNRLVAESERPVADVFWSGDPVRAASLVSRGIGTMKEGVAHSQASGPSRLRLIIVNRDRKDPGDVELNKVTDLARPEIASKSCIANPMFGTTSMHAAALFELLGEDEAKSFFQDFSANGGRMLASNGEVRRRVASGEFIYGLTDSDDVSVALADGKMVDYVIPDQEGVGVIVIPTVAVVINKAPHPKEARALTKFLESSEVESMLAQSDAAYFPSDPSVPPPAVFSSISLKQLKTANLNVEKLSVRLGELHEGFLREWVEQQSH